MPRSIPFPGVDYINFCCTLRQIVHTLRPTFEKLFTGVKVWRKAQNMGVGRKRVYEIDPRQTQMVTVLCYFFLFKSWNLTRYQTKPHWVMLMGIESHGRSNLVTWYTYHGNHRVPPCKIEQNRFSKNINSHFFQKFKFSTTNYIYI